MKKHNKYRIIQIAAYIACFVYLIVLSIGIFDFAQHKEYVPYLIVVPLIAYFIVKIYTDSLISKYKYKNAAFSKKDINKSDEDVLRKTSC